MLFAGCAQAQFEPEKPATPTTQTALANATALTAHRAFTDNLAKFKDDADVLVREGVLASRKEKTVHVWARATALLPQEAMEFFLISDKSGKGYEALCESFAKPSDVEAALEFIGLKPGRPVDIEHSVFWPKGDRILIHFGWMEPPAEGKGAGEQRTARAEDLVIDTGTNHTLPQDGFVFSGSYWLKPDADVNGGKPMYAPDVLDAGAIAANFNDRDSVLDVPRQAAKGLVYGTLKMNPKYRFRAGQAVDVVFEPESKDGKSRVRDLTLTVSMPPGNAGPQGAKYTLVDSAGKSAMDGEKLTHLLAAFNSLNEAKLDPFVTVRIDKDMTLESVQQVYRLLAGMDNTKGIRIEAPPDGELYYRAFFPKAELKVRAERLGRPWELHLQDVQGKASGELILPADKINDNGGKGELKWPARTAKEMDKILAENSDKWSQDVLIYAPPTLSYGAMMDLIGVSLKTHPTMFVFIDIPLH